MMGWKMYFLSNTFFGYLCDEFFLEPSTYHFQETNISGIWTMNMNVDVFAGSTPHPGFQSPPGLLHFLYGITINLYSQLPLAGG